MASIISEKSLDIVRATAPVVKENALKITGTFYPKMLGRNPWLFDFFNESNQRAGRQAGAFSEFLSGNTTGEDLAMGSAQQKTLADAIIAYALNIDNLDELSETVTRIAHKHCALGIKPEHYQIVHDNLMEAIGEVLGSAVTADVAAAWSEAVMALAKIFIDVESKLYNETEKTQWSGNREFIITEIIQETSNVSSFRFKPTDSQGTCPFTPGQYVTVYEKPAGREYFAPRHYTVTSEPGDEYYQISVKKLEDPAAPEDPSHDGVMSGYLHSAKVNDKVHLGPIFGPNLMASGDNSRVAAFVSVGIGITPTVAMLQSALEVRPRAAVFHADTNGTSHPFRKHLEEKLSEAGGILSYSYARPEAEDEKSAYYSGGKLTGEKIVRTLKAANIDATKGTDYFVCCGPRSTQPIVNELVDQGVPKECIHLEYFGPFQSASS